MDSTLRINKYLPFALLYFFFNSAFLPLGLLYTTLLTPLFLLWLYQQNRIKYLWGFFLITIPFALVQYFQGIDLKYYIRSYLLFFSVFVFILTVIQFVKVSHSLRMIFRQLLILNTLFVALACILFFIPQARLYMWSVYDISTGILKFPRLSMFTYEPSYYSTLLVPIAFYYYLKMLLFKLPDYRLILCMVTIPLILSFSLGVISGILISLCILFFANIRTFFLKKGVIEYTLITIFILIGTYTIFYFTYPGNPLFYRIHNIFEGKDTSFKGRSFDAYYLAWKVAQEKSIWFGVGLGQVKVLGAEIWNTFYNFIFPVNEITIPNAVAETMAIYGITGLIIRFAIEGYFFFYTKPYTNYFRLGLFIYIFIYQFTGSYFFNLAEYVIWILAFSQVFEEFNKKNIQIKSPL